MSGRNRVPPHSVREPPLGGMPPIHEPLFARGLGSLPHPVLLGEMRDSPFNIGPRQMLPHPALIEEKLANQHQEIQVLLVDNQRLAATHVALKQELASAQHELQRLSHIANTMHSEKDIQLQEAYEKSLKMEADLRGLETMKNEVMQVQADIQKLTAGRQELMGQAQALAQDLNKATSDLQQVPSLKADIESLKQELQRGRASIEYVRKDRADHYEQGQVMEQNLLLMAREMEKLRAEIANAEKRAHAAAAAAVAGGGGSGHQGASYGGGYGNPDPHGVNSYPASYGSNYAQSGTEGVPYYGSGPTPWGAYDIQRNQARR